MYEALSYRARGWRSDLHTSSASRALAHMGGAAKWLLLRCCMASISRVFVSRPRGCRRSSYAALWPRGGGGGHALGALGGAAAAERVARGGRGMQVMHLIECGGSFWSAVPEGRMSPPAPSSAASAPSSAASAASSAASAPSSAGASSTGPSPSASSPLASSPLAGKSVLAV